MTLLLFLIIVSEDLKDWEVCFGSNSPIFYIFKALNPSYYLFWNCPPFYGRLMFVEVFFVLPCSFAWAPSKKSENYAKLISLLPIVYIKFLLICLKRYRTKTQYLDSHLDVDIFLLASLRVLLDSFWRCCNLSSQKLLINTSNCCSTV